MSSFTDLPVRRPGPPYNAWDLYGPDDELGRLNLITPEAVRRGRDAIKQGISISLNMPLDMVPMNPARKALDHAVGHCNDDHVSFNTQASTQWDGFRHYPYLDYPSAGQYTYYGGQSSEDASSNVSRNGIQNYVKRPITSRGHLLDVCAYLERHSLEPLSYFDNTTPISAEILDGCAMESNIDFEPGDILLVRTGWTEAFMALTKEEQEALPVREKRAAVGMAQGSEMLAWHWDNGFAAVVTDTVGYETLPALSRPSCHEVFLAGWGMPIGELFDLRQLAAECERSKQWTFMFTSMVLNVEGGIASPANAQAIL